MKRSGFTIVTFISAVFFIVGSVFVGVAVYTYSDMNHLKTVPLVPRGVITDSEPGREVFIMGTIGERNAPAYDPFVAYIREERYYDSEDSQYKWANEETVTPPFELETETGRVQVEQRSSEGQYGMHNPPETVYVSEDIRYRGFVHNNTVLVQGAVQADLEGNILDAEMVMNGTREEFLEERRTTMLIFLMLGLIMLSVAMIDLVVFFGIVRRRRR